MFNAIFTVIMTSNIKTHLLAAFAALVSPSALVAAPVVIEQPLSAVVSVSSPGWVTCLVQGAGPFQFVWQKDGVNLSSSASALIYSFTASSITGSSGTPYTGTNTMGVLYFPAEAEAEAGIYQVTVTDVGSRTATVSGTATLSLPNAASEPARFTSRLAITTSVNAGDTVTLTAPYAGTSVTSSWSFYDAATRTIQSNIGSGPTLTLSNVQPSQNGFYILRISNAFPAPWGSRGTTYTALSVK